MASVDIFHDYSWIKCKLSVGSMIPVNHPSIFWHLAPCKTLNESVGINDMLYELQILTSVE